MIALHVLDDDAFLHPEPSTAAGDHLASGLVPVAVAVALAFVYPRLRPGLRACVTLACGSLALVGGVGTSVRHVAIASLGGDDFTGLLATAAGAVLVVLAVVTLWRTRRSNEPRGRRYVRRSLAVVALGVAALFVVVPIGLAILATHKARAPVASADLGRPYERVSFRASDGLSSPAGTSRRATGRPS